MKAAELESELETFEREIKLLKKSEKKTRAIRGALPHLMEGFNSVYDLYYVKIDTEVKSIRVNPKAKVQGIPAIRVVGGGTAQTTGRASRTGQLSLLVS